MENPNDATQARSEAARIMKAVNQAIYRASFKFPANHTGRVSWDGVLCVDVLISAETLHGRKVDRIVWIKGINKGAPISAFIRNELKGHDLEVRPHYGDVDV